ncbi:MAG: FkbM family methyltransferase [Chitinispirillaceae bacterium]
MFQAVVPTATRPIIRRWLAFSVTTAKGLKRLLYRKPRQWSVNLENQTLKAQEYAGYVVLSSRGTSLMSRLQNASDVYEPQLVKALSREIKRREARWFLDVGANIGLISLAVLRRFPYLKIEAFDPGPHQYQLFNATIRYNHLEPQVHLHQIALSDDDGETDFFVHADEHVSGDGMVDTGRSGSARKIRVPTQRLDSWWNWSQKPDIPIVKIDTEGAELLVLRGAARFLAQCRPTLFLEIWPGNMHHYPYQARDILVWLNEHNYRLETLKGESVNSATSNRFWGHDITFVAKHMLQQEMHKGA